MRNNFYLKHPLMAMDDYRMVELFEQEGPKGIGVYWIIVEKLSMHADARAKLEKIKTYCASKKTRFSYLKRIIYDFQLFDIEEDGYISPKELNKARKKDAILDKNSRKSECKSTDCDEKSAKKRQKMTSKRPFANDEKQAKSLIHSDLAQNRTAFKENIRDIKTTATTKEEEKIAAIGVDDVKTMIEGKASNRDKTPSQGKTSSQSNASNQGETPNSAQAARTKQNLLIAYGQYEQPAPPLQPALSWRELVDQLSEKIPWLEVVCTRSGYGELLMRRIKDAIEHFKQHIELYAKGEELQSMTDVRRYFAHFTRAESVTSKALKEALQALDDKDEAAAPPDPYRYEFFINNQRTYMGCIIPHDAPPRPSEDAFWNRQLREWVL